MRKLISILTIIFFASCKEIARDNLSNLTPPILVVANNIEGIALCDSNNTYVYLTKDYYLAKILNEYKKGDTIVYRK